MVKDFAQKNEHIWLEALTVHEHYLKLACKIRINFSYLGPV